MSKIKMEDVTLEDLKTETPKRKVKDRSLRAAFALRLAEIDIEKLKKPWMAKKSLQLITTEEALKAYVDSILTDPSMWRHPYYNSTEKCPIVAVDTETYGLDTRVMITMEGGVPLYELNIEIAGVVLSADGIKGVYIPLTHEDGNNVPMDAATRELQRLFDASHLVFYHAKFDREVMRQTMGIKFRDYPHYEDVQSLQYSNDPKAQLDSSTSFVGGTSGLKGLAKELLGIEQIELDELTKVRAERPITDEEMEEIRLRPEWIKLSAKQAYFCDQCSLTTSSPKCMVCGSKPTLAKGCKECKLPFEEVMLACPECDDPVRKITCSCGAPAVQMRTQVVGEGKSIAFECAQCSTKVTYPKRSVTMQHVPFMWLPTEIAVWYAAGDGITTWLLWDHTPSKENPEDPEPDSMHVEAQKRKVVHHIDGQLIDTLSWMERQRLYIDTEAHDRMLKWDQRNKADMLRELQEIAVEDGWEEFSDDDGNVVESSRFNPNSKLDMPKLLFDIKGFTPTKVTSEGHRSVDSDVLVDLRKSHPHDKFLRSLHRYKEYVALHPESLTYDKRDNTARIYLKQSRTAGGRLAAGGGKFVEDGGVSINPQAVKKVAGNWWVKGDVLVPDYILEDEVEPHDESELDPSCFQEARPDDVMSADGRILHADDPEYASSAESLGFQQHNGKWCMKAPGILKNHIANYLGYAICLVPSCTTCAEKHGILIKKTRLDANQIMNLRSLFCAENEDWTFLCTDYSNIEVRGAANVTGETELQKIFLEGDGDHHALTASKVFAEEWGGPNTTKGRRKELRSVAKTINFALQYGGTEYTIYENLKELIPGLTLQKTQEMVATYWAGVPRFKEWCDEQQRVAREQMVCYTPTGRVIKFKSAMKALGLYIPEPEQRDLMYLYYRVRKQLNELVARRGTWSDDEQEQARKLKDTMDQLWSDRDTGVRNAIEYNKFLSKIERVAVNAPVQGLAGDFMRIALNRIRRYCTQTEPAIQSVLRLHNTVHDEIDYSVKNKYLPFVVPRITRLMKLRSLHKAQNWPVPIEADTEYGRSWDVQYHLTGDDGHKPSGWTDVKGMETYLPPGFELSTVDKLVNSIASGEDAKRDRVVQWFKSFLHPRAMEALDYALWENKKDGVKLTAPEIIRKQLIATLQLHEYWTVDEDEDPPETLVEFEARAGLTAADRGFMPEDGWLCSVPQDKVKRKAVPRLGSFSVELDEDTPEINLDVAQPMVEPEPEPAPEEPVNPMEPAEPAPAEPAPTPSPTLEDDLFYEPTPKVKVEHPVAAQDTVVAKVKVKAELPVIRPNLQKAEGEALMDYLVPGCGDYTVEALFQGEKVTFRKCFRADIPQDYLVSAE